MPQGLDHEMALNAILYAGEPEIQEMEVETSSTQLCPGKLVIVGTADYQCAVAGAASGMVLGVADVPSDQKLTAYYTPSIAGTVTKGFTAGDQIRVLRGDIVVKLIIKSNKTTVVGQRLVAATNGMVEPATADSGAPEDIVGYSLENKTTEGLTLCDWVLVKLTI